jgi:hypothetical protein
MRKWEKFKKDLMHNIDADRTNRKGFDAQLRKPAKVPKHKDCYDDQFYDPKGAHNKPKKLQPLTSNYFSTLDYALKK